MLKRFDLVRQKDWTGVSGTGVIAEGIWDDRTDRAILIWPEPTPTVTFFQKLDDLVKIHNHVGTKSEGGTFVQWID